MRKLLFAGFFIFALAPLLKSQHQPHLQGQEPLRHWRTAVLIGHTFIPAGNEPGRLIIPSWGFDLEYWGGEKWGIGLHNDLEIETFLVEHEGETEVLEREYPLVLTFDALFRPWKGLVLQLGPGLELERNEDFLLLRTGLEYEFEFGHHWDISPAFFYDTREGAYDTWSLALGVGKRF